MHQQYEQALAERARRGEREALGQLWDEFTPKLFGYLVNQTRNRTLAEDLLQSTWMKVLEALPRFEPRGAGFGAWLFAIARNECRQHWRKPETEELTNDEAEKSAADATLDSAILVEQILDLLSEDDRELLRLRYIADLSVGDVAKVLNINGVAARVRIFRAIARARAALASQNV